MPCSVAASHDPGTTAVEIESVESTIEGDLDVQGLLGISKDVRNGYQGIRLSFKVKGDADDETLRKICLSAPAAVKPSAAKLRKKARSLLKMR